MFDALKVKNNCMKLKITDYFWAVGRKTRKVKTVCVPLAVGPIEDFDVGCTWQIDEVNEKSVKLSVIRHDGVIIKTFTIEDGKNEYWRPRSMDAGHEYTMKLVCFF